MALRRWLKSSYVGPSVALPSSLQYICRRYDHHARLHPLRNSHLRLLRHADRLGSPESSPRSTAFSPPTEKQSTTPPSSNSTEISSSAPNKARSSPTAKSWSRSSAQFGDELGFTPTAEEARSLPDSLSTWKPWPDTVAALRQLKTRFRLAILSNVDDDLFATDPPQTRS